MQDWLPLFESSDDAIIAKTLDGIVNKRDTLRCRRNCLVTPKTKN